MGTFNGFLAEWLYLLIWTAPNEGSTEITSKGKARCFVNPTTNELQVLFFPLYKKIMNF